MDTYLRRLRAPVAIVVFSLLAGAGLAASDAADPFDDMLSPYESNADFDYDDSADKPWREGAVEQLPLPADSDLLPVRLDALPPGLQAYMSPNHLVYSAGDRVFRFWLIIKSSAGAYNGTYEGLRCEAQEYRVYAYGNPRRQPPVRANSTSSWQAVGIGAKNYRRELLVTLMCDESRRPAPLRDVVATLRGHRAYRSPSPENPDY